MDERRRWLIPGAVFAALAALPPLAAFLGGPGTVLGAPDSDLQFQHLAWREFGFGELKQGRLPLWNPHIFGGAPFFGGFQSALLYPLNWAHLFLSLAAAVNLYIALHLFLAGLLTALWCQKRGASVAGSVVGGLVFASSGPFYFHVYAGHLPQLGSMVWAPAILMCVDALSAGEGPGWLLFGMAAVSLQIAAGSPQHVYYTALGAGIYALSRPPGTWTKTLRGLFLLYAGASLLSAVQLWTGFQAALECVRGAGAQRAFAATFSLPPENLATLAAPFVFGDEHLVPYIGRTYLWESCLYVGSGALTLAALGFASSRRDKFLLIALAAVVALALGSHTPLFGVLYRWLPAFDLFRGTAKFGWLIALFLATAAAAGFDMLAQERTGMRRTLTAFAASLFLFAGAWYLRSPAGVDRLWRPLMTHIAASQESPLSPKLYQDPDLTALTARFASGELMNAAFVFLACAGLLFLARRRPEARWGLALLVFLELAGFARAITRVSSSAPAAGGPWQEALARGKPERRVLDPGRTTADLGMRLGLDGVWGYDPFVLRRYAEFITASQGAPIDDASQYAYFKSTPPIYRLLRVGAAAMPRLSLIHSARVIPDKSEMLKAVLAPDFDPTRTVLLEAPPKPEPQPGATGTVRLLEARPGRLDVEADLPSPGILLITDSYSTGWRAEPRSPGPQSSYEVLPADYALQAIPLSAGRHSLRLVYEPIAFRLGLWISLFSSVAFSIAGMIFFRRSRAKADPGRDGT